jgi:Undecaprenyl-phosphate glucose phosphotransferase
MFDVPRSLCRFRTARVSICNRAGPPREQAMNIQQGYALRSRPDTNQALRWWTALTQTTFFSVILLSDVLVIVAMACLTGVAYHLAVYRETGDVISFLEIGALSATIFVIPNLFRGEYVLANFFSFKPHVRRSIQLWNVTIISLLVIAFLAQISVIYSRGWTILFYGTTICALLALRYCFVQATVLGSQAGLITAQRIFLVGTGKHIEGFIARYRPWTLGVNVVGCQFLKPVEPGAPTEFHHQTLAQDLEEALGSARSVEPDAIFLLIPWSATDTINRCAAAFLSLPAEIHLGPEQVLDRFDNVQLSRLGPMTSLQLTRLPLSGLERLEKRAIDLLLAGASLVLLTPLLVAVAILIKLDSPGPVFFMQRRYGFNQKPFRTIKFRTMCTLDDGAVVPQARRNDPRITRIGAWLRRWNIDEIPQLFNVLMGDMSLVGPRPHALSHNRDYEQRISFYARRHNVKPGITGWAQIHGLRGETDTDEKMKQRVEYDLFYIDNWSPGLDVQILFRTVFSARSYRNAY